MTKDWTHFPLSATRFNLPTKTCPITGNVMYDACALFYGKQSAGCWRFVVRQCGYMLVGEKYATRAELLADMNRYAEQWGFMTP